MPSWPKLAAVYLDSNLASFLKPLVPPASSMSPVTCIGLSCYLLLCILIRAGLLVEHWPAVYKGKRCVLFTFGHFAES